MDFLGNGPWRGSRRAPDFDTQSIQTNDVGSRYGNNGKTHDFSTAYHDCIRTIQVHVETTLNRFHDLYERKDRLTEADRLSEASIEKLLPEYNNDRVAAALHLLDETYKKVGLPQADNAHKTLLDWWEYLRHHRNPNRKPNAGEIAYECKKAQAAKEAATDLWQHYNRLLEDKNRWLDTYMEEVNAREKDAYMKMRIQALNARDKEFALESTQKINPNALWFNDKAAIPTRHRQSATNLRAVSGHQKVDYDNMGHSEAREADKKAIGKMFHDYRVPTQVMGEKSEDHKTTIAIIDTGNDGPNVVTFSFLQRLKLQNVVKPLTGNEPEMKDASGNTFQPRGRVDLYFKFERFPLDWHADYFLVSDAEDYDLIFGMPCLLQDSIKCKIILPLVSNNKSKKTGSRDSQGPQDAEFGDRVERSDIRRGQVRGVRSNGGGGGQGNNNSSSQRNNNGGGQVSNNNGGRTTTNAFLGVRGHSQGRLAVVSEEIRGPSNRPSEEGSPFEPWEVMPAEHRDWADDEFDNSSGNTQPRRPESSDLGHRNGRGQELKSNEWPELAKSQTPREPAQTSQMPLYSAREADPEDTWTQVPLSKKSRRGKQAVLARNGVSGEKKGG